MTADQAKYSYVLAALDQDTASCLLDLLSHPPTIDERKAPTGIGNVICSVQIRRVAQLHPAATLLVEWFVVGS